MIRKHSSDLCWAITDGVRNQELEQALIARFEDYDYGFPLPDMARFDEYDQALAS